MWGKQDSGLIVKKNVICQNPYEIQFLSHNVLISVRELLSQRRLNIALVKIYT